MKLGRRLVSLSCVVLCLAVTACAGEDGEPGAPGAPGAPGQPGAEGAEGPKGEDGTDGTNGTNGVDGADGTDGTNGTGDGSNVFSAWLSVAFTPNADPTGFQADIPVPELTSELLATGDIRVYVNTGAPASPTVRELPIAEHPSLLVDMTVSAAGIHLESNVDLSTATNAQGARVNQFRYVHIAGTKPAD